MIEAKAIHKTFAEGERQLAVLRGVELTLAPGQKLGIVGSSGAGKSTLLHILGGLDPPSLGSVFVEKEDLYALKEAKRAKLRNRYFGFVFQFYHLIPELSVLENVALPAWIAGLPKAEANQLAKQALGRVRLDDRWMGSPVKLSGGEQQRVAIARALVLEPKTVLADEPTGNLDQATGLEVMGYLLETVEAVGGSLILVTHNRELVRNWDAIYELREGILHKI